MLKSHRPDIDLAGANRLGCGKSCALVGCAAQYFWIAHGHLTWKPNHRYKSDETQDGGKTLKTDPKNSLESR